MTAINSAGWNNVIIVTRYKNVANDLRSLVKLTLSWLHIDPNLEIRLQYPGKSLTLNQAG